MCSEPLSINAGCACYFLGQEMLNQVECTNETKLRMYQIWIEALRGGHAGQGLDIHGSDHLMDAAVESGDSTPVEASVHCIHRLKTAFPARCLAQMGAIYGGGSDEEVDAIGVFFEATGLAFQIIDDVLNLRGLVKPGEKMSQALKVVGEDITEGKVTAPIAKAMSLLKTKEERKVRRTYNRSTFVNAASVCVMTGYVFLALGTDFCCWLSRRSGISSNQNRKTRRS